MVMYSGQHGQRFYSTDEIGKEDGQSEVTISKPKMNVEESGGINWTWFKVQNGNLVAIFRLHYGEEPLAAFRKLEKRLMVRVDKMDVPWGTWREEDMAPYKGRVELVTDHVKHVDGYNLPEVAEAFGWLNQMFRDTGGDFERERCPEGSMHHLEYHGVAIVRILK